MEKQRIFSSKTRPDKNYKKCSGCARVALTHINKHDWMITKSISLVIGEEKCRRFCFERSSVDYLKIDGQFAVLRYTKHGPHCSGPLQSTPIFFSLCRTTPPSHSTPYINFVSFALWILCGSVPHTRTAYYIYNKHIYVIIIYVGENIENYIGS